MKLQGSLTRRPLRRLAFFCVCLFLSWAIFRPVTVLADDTRYSSTLYGTWEKDEKGWRFLRNYNPIYPTAQWGDQNGNSYYFDEAGYLVTGWQYIDYHWYYFHTEEGKNQGALIKGWIHDEASGGWYYSNDLGIMVTGWHKINGYWYYFNPHSDGHMGLMAVDQVVDNAYVNSDGRMNEPR